jgi:hypothetical protein
MRAVRPAKKVAYFVTAILVLNEIRGVVVVVAVGVPILKAMVAPYL